MIREYRIAFESSKSTLYDEPLFGFDWIGEQMMSPDGEVQNWHFLFIRIQAHHSKRWTFSTIVSICEKIWIIIIVVGKSNW